MQNISETLPFFLGPGLLGNFDESGRASRQVRKGAPLAALGALRNADLHCSGPALFLKHSKRSSTTVASLRKRLKDCERRRKEKICARAKRKLVQDSTTHQLLAFEKRQRSCGEKSSLQTDGIEKIERN